MYVDRRNARASQSVPQSDADTLVRDRRIKRGNSFGMSLMLSIMMRSTTVPVGSKYEDDEVWNGMLLQEETMDVFLVGWEAQGTGNDVNMFGKSR